MDLGSSEDKESMPLMKIASMAMEIEKTEMSAKVSARRERGRNGG